MVHPDLTGRTVYRDLADARAQGAVFHKGHPFGPAFGGRLVPFCHFSCLLEGGQGPGRFGHQPAPQVNRVFAQVMCNLVEGAFNGEFVRAVPHRTPVLEADAVGSAPPFGPLVGDVVMVILHPAGHQVAPVAHHQVRQAGDLPLPVYPGLQALQAHGAEGAIAYIVFARPDQLHGPGGHFPGQFGALPDKIAHAAPAEAPAQVLQVDVHIFRGNAQLGRHPQLGVGALLAAYPNVCPAAVCGHLHNGVQGFHLCVVDIVVFEIGRVGFGSPAEGVFKIPLIGNHLPFRPSVGQG